MKDLRVVFPAAGRARLSDADGHDLGVEVPFTPFLGDDDYEDLRWYLEEYMDLPDGGAIVRAERIEGNLEQWGHKLHDALFTAEENRTLLDQLLAGPEPRELTIATQDPELLRLPWELMANESGSLAQRVSMRRQLERPEKTTPRPAQLPLRILYIVSRPADAGFIDPRLTAKALLDALDPLGASVRVDFCRPPTLARMKEMLYEGQQAGDPYDLVHFDGHGNFQPEEQIGVLCFEKPDDGSGFVATDFVPADQLGDLLTEHAIPLIVLEACRSATLGKTDVFGSVAPSLIQAGVGSVLSMGHAVHVEATRLLLDCFYRELVRGATIGYAVAQARSALLASPARWIEYGPRGRTVELRDWFLPHLYQRDADDALVPPEAARQQPERQIDAFPTQAPGPFPPPPLYGFQGRARELHELERQFRTQRGIVLHAMGGMGKTALATEAAHWWTRSGLFRDGACFLSFEQFASADRAVQVLGMYLDGPRFEQLPAAEQRRRAIELFRQKEVVMVWDSFESALPQFDTSRRPPGAFRKWLARVVELFKSKQPLASTTQSRGSPYTADERNRITELFRDLTTGPGKGCLLVTCRPLDLSALPSAQHYELHGLAHADSLWLLSSILRRHDLTLDDPRLSRDKLDPLLRDLADHPLSLELVGPHLRTLTPEAISADLGKLLAKFQQEAPEGRNQSLLASLEFSRRHLSPAALEALPWLGLFSGGVFEHLLLGVSQLTPEAWEPIRRELQGFALVRIEDDVHVDGRPFLRFHPTLAHAVADPTLAQNREVRKRFLGIYISFTKALHIALRGSQPRAALEVLGREEANYLIALQWAAADQWLRAAAALGDTFCNYLEMSGRFRERDAWVQWLKEAVTQQGFTAESAGYEREHAWTLFTQGDPQGAVDQLQSLIERLRHTIEFDPAVQLAFAIHMLGRVLHTAGASAQAVLILREAVSQWEALVEKAEGQPWEELLASTGHTKATLELNNLSGAMGDLAETLSKEGKHAEALALAERCVRIHQKLRNLREFATDQGRCARILMEAGRYDEADGRYELALARARQAGDKGLEGVILNHQGGLAIHRDQPERASRLFQQALQRLQEAGDQRSMMETYSLLGVAEQKAGRLAEARAWYENSRKLAVQLKDQPSLGAAAQNLGIMCLEEGEAAHERGDKPAARRHFEEARHSAEESLRVWQALGDKPHEADSWGHLAIVHLRLGDLAAAEHHAHEARKIHESLGLMEAWIDYDTFSEIAQARGAPAAEWAKKRDDLLEKLGREAGGDGGLTAQMLETLQDLTLACAQAGVSDGSLGRYEEEALAQLDQFPAPFPDFAAFLRQIAAGQLAAIPGGLPNELRQWLEDLVQGIRGNSG